MTPPSSIEEAAKRVLELHAEAITGHERPTLDSQFFTLAPQLAQWVEKALPVIEAAQEFVREWEMARSEDVRRPTRATQSISVTLALATLVDRVAALDTPSSLAAEGTP